VAIILARREVSFLIVEFYNKMVDKKGLNLIYCSTLKGMVQDSSWI